MPTIILSALLVVAALGTALGGGEPPACTPADDEPVRASGLLQVDARSSPRRHQLGEETGAKEAPRPGVHASLQANASLQGHAQSQSNTSSHGHARLHSNASLHDLTQLQSNASLHDLTQLQSNASLKANASANSTVLSAGGVFNSVNESTVYFVMLIAVAYVLVYFACQLEKTGEVQRVEGWTGFRFCLALWIFLEHHHLHPMTGSGSFLLLSGAMLSLSRRDVTDVSGYLSFLARRLFRIYPAYWLALCAFLVVRHSIAPEEALVTLPFKHPGLFLALQPWMHNGKDNRLWFIGTVIELYVLFPILSRLLGRLGTRQSASKCVMVAMTCYAAQWCVALFAMGQGYGIRGGKSFRTSVLGLNVKPYTSPFMRLPQFVMGMSLGHLVQALSGKEYAWQGWVLSGVTDAAAAGAVAIAVAGRFFEFQVHQFSQVFNDFFLFSPVVYLLLLGIALATRPSHTTQFLTWTPIRVLGKWSYGIYLWNLFITLSHSWWAHDSAWGIITDYAFCVVVSALSFLLVEEPSQKLVDWLLERRR